MAWLAKLRAHASDPSAFLVIISRKTCGGSMAIFPDDIVGKTDDELLAFIAGRFAEH